MERHLSTYPGVVGGADGFAKSTWPAVSTFAHTGKSALAYKPDVFVREDAPELWDRQRGIMSIESAIGDLKGYTRAEHVPKSSYRDSSMCVVIPTRDDSLRIKFVERLNAMMPLMNQRRYMFFVSGAEVGQAYNDMVKAILENPELSSCRYLMTIEDDTLVPPDAALKLCESIEAGPFDGVGGMYWTKGDFNMPMIYGDPAEYARTGRLEFRPLDPTPALAAGNSLIECNGIANGCTLFRMQAFRDVPAPWFQTLSDPSVGAMTQDLYWCRKARLAGKRFAVDMRVKCGHVDWKTGIVY